MDALYSGSARYFINQRTKLTESCLTWLLSNFTSHLWLDPTSRYLFCNASPAYYVFDTKYQFIQQIPMELAPHLVLNRDWTFNKDEEEHERSIKELETTLKILHCFGVGFDRIHHKHEEGWITGNASRDSNNLRHTCVLFRNHRHLPVLFWVNHSSKSFESYDLADDISYPSGRSKMILLSMQYARNTFSKEWNKVEKAVMKYIASLREKASKGYLAGSKKEIKRPGYLRTHKRRKKTSPHHK